LFLKAAKQTHHHCSVYNLYSILSRSYKQQKRRRLTNTVPVLKE